MRHRQLEITPVSLPLRAAFTISRGSKTEARTVRVTITEAGKSGRGESVPYARFGESVDGVTASIEGLRGPIEAGLDRDALQAALPAGAARCAIDCALWDLEAKQTGIPVWQRAGLPAPLPLETAATISLGEADTMCAHAMAAQGTILKLKIGSEADLEKIRAVHAARPDARLIIDANEGLSSEAFLAIMKAASRLGIVLVEQPFPAGKDSMLMKRPGPVAICADESAHVRADIQSLARCYDAVNIKLDKAGGLTEAIAMAHAARRAGMGIMVGCMVASSLSIAPAFLLAGLADAADLDGPQWLRDDISEGLLFEGGRVMPPRPALWG